MTSAPTPNTPDLSSEKNNDGVTPSIGNAVVFDSGKSNGNGKNGHGHGSSGSGKRKKKGKASKKKSSQRESSTASPVFTTADIVNDHKRVHGEDSSHIDGIPSPHKKKQRKSSSPSPWMRLVLCVAFFALGAFATLPLVFSTFTLLGCGGGTNVKSMVDLVLLKKQSEDETSFGDFMMYFQRYSASLDNATDRKKKGRGKTDDKTSIGGSASSYEDPSLDIQESMCHVSYIVIGHFAHYLPHAQYLVLRNPFAALEDIRPATKSEDTTTSTAVKRKGMFQRVLSKHRKKHHNDQEFTSAASEEIDRQHPLRYILEGASIFIQHRKKKKLERKERKNRKKGGVERKEDGGQIEVDWNKWKYAMSDDYKLEPDEIALVKELGDRVKSKNNTVCKDNTTGCEKINMQIASLSGGTNMPHRTFQERIDAVSWGGVDSHQTRWWSQKDNGKDSKKASAQIEGGRLLAAYLKIMNWPKDMYAKYPFRLCAKGCDSEISLLHTLEWREKYKPWCTSDDAVQFNKDGFIYSRGHSKPGPKQRSETESSSMNSASKAAFLAGAGHSMVYYRPGLASPAEDPELYSRSMINALEHAVSDSLIRNNGAIGRFNVVMDCTGMSSKNSPSISQVKRFFSMLQDHFPDRLGVLLAANLSGLAQIAMRMVLPFVTDDVRAKIHIIPDGAEERREMLLQFMDEEEIPHYLGGRDGYDFDAREYYKEKCTLSEEDITAYHLTMPYHA